MGGVWPSFPRLKFSCVCLPRPWKHLEEMLKTRGYSIIASFCSENHSTELTTVNLHDARLFYHNVYVRRRSASMKSMPVCVASRLMTHKYCGSSVGGASPSRQK